METQQIIIWALFLVAAGYMGWRVWKAFDRRNSGGCDKGCGCAADKISAAKTH